MDQYITSIIAGCATQGLISTFLWHRGLLGLPARVMRIESDLSDIKAELRDIRSEMRDMRSELKSDITDLKLEMREMRNLILRLNERIDKLIDKS